MTHRWLLAWPHSCYGWSTGCVVRGAGWGFQERTAAASLRAISAAWAILHPAAAGAALSLHSPWPPARQRLGSETISLWRTLKSFSGRLGSCTCGLGKPSKRYTKGWIVPCSSCKAKLQKSTSFQAKNACALPTSALRKDLFSSCFISSVEGPRQVSMRQTAESLQKKP